MLRKRVAKPSSKASPVNDVTAERIPRNLQDLATSQALNLPFRFLLFICFIPIISLSLAIIIPSFLKDTFQSSDKGYLELFANLIGLRAPGSSTSYDLIGRLTYELLVVMVVSVFGYVLTAYMVPLVAPKLVATLYGVDIGKRGLGGLNDGEKVPESLGLVSGFVLMLCIAVCQVLLCTELNGKFDFLVEVNKLKTDNNEEKIFTMGCLNQFNAALSSICFATLLGLVDDVIDIRWRHKVSIGFFMCLPLLLSYTGGTTILVPNMFRPLMKHISLEGSGNDLVDDFFGFISGIFGTEILAQGNLIETGMLYYVYMFVLIVFCTNSINIYAGINGLEVGQSVIMGIAVATVNLIEILYHQNITHIFSLVIILPFVATSIGLLKYNFYPAQVFVGDVYPYYAGMTIAVAAILGHFPKSLFLLMIPQLLNFLYSLPQLFGLVPCPRHRLPRINLKTGFLEASKVDPTNRNSRSNMTLLCLFLDVFGPMHERTLCFALLFFQVVCSIIGIFLRFIISPYF